jgi:hypothetical protein
VADAPHARDVDGLLYEPPIRESLRSALPGGELTRYEALLALRRAAFVLDRQTTAVRNIAIQGDPGMRVLIRLHNEPSGVTVADLVNDRGQEVLEVLDALDREKMIVRAGESVRLSDLGNERLDGVLRQLADSLAILIEGVSDEQMALLRHISLQLIINHERLRKD